MSLAASEGLRVVSALGERRMVAVGPPRRAFGVPPGGPFDRLSAALANALAGRPESAPILEIALGPIVFEAVEPSNVAVVEGRAVFSRLRRESGWRFYPSGRGLTWQLSLHPPAPSTWEAAPGDSRGTVLLRPPSADPSPGTSHPQKEGGSGFSPTRRAWGTRRSASWPDPRRGFWI